MTRSHPFPGPLLRSLFGALLVSGVLSGPLSSDALAEPNITLQNPVTGMCLGTPGLIRGTPPLLVGEVFEGGVPITSIPLDFFLEESEGLNVQLEILVDEDPNDEEPPVLVQETLITPFQFDRNPGEAYQIQVNSFAVPADAITDGAERAIILRATSGGVTDEDSALVRVDRAPPYVYMEEAEYGLLEQCYTENPPDVASLPIQIIDAQDDNPISNDVTVVDGCVTLRTVTVADDCGNTQEIELRITSDDFPPTISFDGIEEGEVLFGGALSYDVDGQVGCVQSISGTLTRDGEPAGSIIPGQELNTPGEYVARVDISSCGEITATDSRSFTIAEFPALDLGGPYSILQGEAVDLDASNTPLPQEIPVEWAWDTDGDGQYDDGDTAVVPFDGNRPDGDYPIAVRMRAEPNRITFAQTVVEVRDVNPVCALEGPYEVQEGGQVQFDGSASRAGHPLDPLSLWAWDFGDEQSLNAANQPIPRHTFAQEGEYEVTLTLHDIDSTCTATTQVTVTDARPIIQGAGPVQSPVLEGQLAQFTSGLTAPGSAQEPITNYRWTFGVEGAEEFSGAEARNAEFRYLDDGTYTVTVVVEDQDSSTDASFDIEILDLAPDPNFLAPLVVLEGDEITFDARSSRAGGPADELTEFRWDFGDNGPQPEPGLDQDLITHRFLDQGTYTVTLTVTDEDSSEIIQRDIEVLDAEPGVQCPPRFEGLEGEPVDLVGCNVQGGGEADPIERYMWDFGDGSLPLVINGEDPTPDTTYTWADDGVYNARLTVFDEEDVGTSVDTVVVIDNRIPTLEIQASATEVELGTEITFTAVIEDAPGDVPRLVWDMDNGRTFENQTSFAYTYPSRGVYNVRASVDDGDGGTANALLEIRVGSAPPRVEGPLTLTGGEGEQLEPEYTIWPALRDGAFYDEPLQVQVNNEPEGADVQITPPAEDAEPGSPYTVSIRWTPSFVDAGEVDIRLTARSPSGLTRSETLTYTIEDRGTPVLAASAGTADRGRLLLFQYGFDAGLQRATFTPWADLTVGMGAGGIAADDEGRRIFVASPGSGGVAVAELTGDRPEVVRLVPTGADTVDVVYGAGRIWALNARQGTVTLIDPETLKVLRTVSVGDVGPIAMRWLPSGFGDLPNPHLAIIGRRTPSLLLVNAARANAGLPNIITDTLPLGGLPQVILADPRTAHVYIADARRLRVQQVQIAAELPPAVSVPLPFAPDALALADQGGALAATRAGIYHISEGGEVSPFLDFVTTSLVQIDEEVRSERGLALTEGNQIIHLSSGEEAPELPGPAARVRNLSAFIVPKQEAVR